MNRMSKAHPVTRRTQMADIARMAGVSSSTVSRALKDAPDIGAETKERVRMVARQLGYQPNRAGVRLRTGKTNVIALVLGIDEDTALAAEDPGGDGPWSFSVRGRQDAYVVTREGAHSVRDGIDLVVHA